MQCVFIQDTAQDGVSGVLEWCGEMDLSHLTVHFSLLTFGIRNAPYRPIPVLGH